MVGITVVVSGVTGVTGVVVVVGVVGAVGVFVATVGSGSVGIVGFGGCVLTTYATTAPAPSKSAITASAMTSPEPPRFDATGGRVGSYGLTAAGGCAAYGFGGWIGGAAAVPPPPIAGGRAEPDALFVSAASTGAPITVPVPMSGRASAVCAKAFGGTTATGTDWNTGTID